MYRVSDTVRNTHGQDGTIVLDVQRGQIVRLNLTGSLIFQRLQRGETVAQIVDGISRDFCVSRANVRTDVTSFLKSLSEEGLVYMSDTPEDCQ